MKFSVLPQPVGLLKFTLNKFCASTIQGREHCWCSFVRYINIVLCWDTCEPICQAWYDARLDSTLQSDSSSNDLDVKVTGKLELVQSFC